MIAEGRTNYAELPELFFKSKPIDNKWVKNGADYADLPIFEGNKHHEWANVEDNGKLLSIYPFNKNALWNLYFSIDENKRTPRAFLKDVLRYILTLWDAKGNNLFRDEI